VEMETARPKSTLTSVRAAMPLTRGIPAVAAARRMMPARIWILRSTRSASFPNSGFVSAIERIWIEKIRPICQAGRAGPRGTAAGTFPGPRRRSTWPSPPARCPGAFRCGENPGDPGRNPTGPRAADGPRRRRARRREARGPGTAREFQSEGCHVHERYGRDPPRCRNQEMSAPPRSGASVRPTSVAEENKPSFSPLLAG